MFVPVEICSWTVLPSINLEEISVSGNCPDSWWNSPLFYPPFNETYISIFTVFVHRNELFGAEYSYP